MNYRQANYLDIDAILAEEERMTVVFEKNEGASGLGFLDASTMNEDLIPGSRVDLPVWLIEDLKDAYPDRRIFAVRLPAPYREMAKIHTEANAKTVDLKAVSPYYYEFGLKTERLAPRDQTSGLKSTLNTVLAIRVQDVLDIAQNLDDDVSEYVGKLTSMEHKLYVNTVQRSRELTRWKLGQNQVMQAYSAKRTKY